MKKTAATKRKPGRPAENLKRCMIAMPAEDWARLDFMRGTTARGRAIAALIPLRGKKVSVYQK